MTTRDTVFAAGTPCWTDLATSDIDAARAFYGGLFDWSFDDSGEEFGGYLIARSDGHAVAGLMPKPPEAQFPDAWTTYMCTMDIEATTAAVGRAGGEVVMPVMKVGDMGSVAVLADPAGGVFGLWQPDRFPGFGKYNEPGSTGWNEYHSKDFARTTRFYGEVFGWNIQSMSDTDQFRYSTGQVEGRDVVGLMDSAGFLPEQVPSHWAVYFSVPDVDAALLRVDALGGSVTRPAEDTPYGRLADVSDTTGAPFKLHGPTASES